LLVTDPVLHSHDGRNGYEQGEADERGAWVLVNFHGISYCWLRIRFFIPMMESRSRIFPGYRKTGTVAMTGFPVVAAFVPVLSGVRNKLRDVFWWCAYMLISE